MSVKQSRQIGLKKRASDIVTLRIRIRLSGLDLHHEEVIITYPAIWSDNSILM